MSNPTARPLTARAVAVAIAVLSAFAPPVVARHTDEFTLLFHNASSSYDTAAAFVLPNEPVPLEARGAAGAAYAVLAKDGELTSEGVNRWTWRAPARPGLYTLEIVGATAQPRVRERRIVLHAFVMVPASEVRGGRLNGYRIGEYPPNALRGNPVYRPPAGFVEVTPEVQAAKISPHFQIGQFLCKQADPFPRYLVLDERLPIKLESLVDRLDALGYNVSGLTVMSGYRTPFYNRSLGNVTFSMHQFGGAADVFVDENHNGRMDDLTRDARIDRRDAIELYEIADRLSREKGYLLQGGLGHYPATGAHGPFVHVDVRGGAARWAD